MRVIAVEEHYANADLGGRRGLAAEVAAKLTDLGEGRIAEMDAAGIDVQVLSLLAPGAQAFGAADAAARAREDNDRLAGAVSRHPDRLAAFASLPTADPRAAAVELERTVNGHGFKGGIVHGQTEGRFLDDRRFWPILEAAEQLRVPIYLHPAPPPATVIETYYAGFAPAVSSNLSTGAWGWHIETGLHVLRLVLAGAFDRFPRLQIVVGHLGEALPFMLARTGNRLSPAVTGLPRTVQEYLRDHVHLSLGGFFSVSPFLNAMLEFGADRILFSVDHPLSSNQEGRAFLDAVPISPADREKIAHRNAERLLRL
ncbi:MAG: amidohydrolase [Candidatus Dormibacteraeota bacterium]|nr:amidohydrolase [Candidatus Dormibacteraeota bacterium]